MNHRTLGLVLFITAYFLYAASLPAWALCGLYMMVGVGIFGYGLAYIARYESVKMWLNRYF